MSRAISPHLLLIVGQRKGQCRKHASDERTIGSVCNPLLLLGCALLERKQPALDEVQLLERKPSPRRTQFLLLFGKMNAPKGSPASDETVLLTNALRKRLLDLIPRMCERIRHHLPQLLLRQPLGRRIDGQDAKMILHRIP